MSKNSVSVHFEIFAAPGRPLPAKVSNKRSLTLLQEFFAQSPACCQVGSASGDRARSAPLTVTPLGARTGRFPSKIVSMHAHHDHAACPCTGTQCTAYVVHRCALTAVYGTLRPADTSQLSTGARLHQFVRGCETAAKAHSRFCGFSRAPELPASSSHHPCQQLHKAPSPVSVGACAQHDAW